jgi:hypothetical protein
MMMGQPTQYDFEFPFGPPATQIEHGKSTSAETMLKKAATLDAHFASSLSPIKQGQLYRFALGYSWLWATLWSTRRRIVNQQNHKPDDPQSAKHRTIRKAGLIFGLQKLLCRYELKGSGCYFV